MKGEELNKIKEILNKNELEKKINKIKRLSEQVRNKYILENQEKEILNQIDYKTWVYKKSLIEKEILPIQNQIKITEKDEKKFLELLYKEKNPNNESFFKIFTSDPIFNSIKSYLEEKTNSKLQCIEFNTFDRKVVDYESVEFYSGGEKMVSYDFDEEIEDYVWMTILAPEHIVKTAKKFRYADILLGYETIFDHLSDENVFVLNERTKYGTKEKTYINSNYLKEISAIDKDFYFKICEMYLINRTIEENQSKIERLKNEYSAHKKQIEEIENTLNELEK